MIFLFEKFPINQWLCDWCLVVNQLLFTTTENQLPYLFVLVKLFFRFFFPDDFFFGKYSHYNFISQEKIRKRYNLNQKSFQAIRAHFTKTKNQSIDRCHLVQNSHPPMWTAEKKKTEFQPTNCQVWTHLNKL